MDDLDAEVLRLRTRLSTLEMRLARIEDFCHDPSIVDPLSPEAAAKLREPKSTSVDLPEGEYPTEPYKEQK